MTTYKGFRIIKVTQPGGRITYDIQDPSGHPWEWAIESLKVAKATINAELGK